MLRQPCPWRDLLKKNKGGCFRDQVCAGIGILDLNVDSLYSVLLYLKKGISVLIQIQKYKPTSQSNCCRIRRQSESRKKLWRRTMGTSIALYFNKVGLHSGANLTPFLGITLVALQRHPRSQKRDLWWCHQRRWRRFQHAADWVRVRGGAQASRKKCISI